ncbi:uncharacterized protein METZ01_LOCUS250125, partial [marine metagenome]
PFPHCAVCSRKGLCTFSGQYDDLMRENPTRRQSAL